MTLKALDLLRILGWALIDFIFSLLDSLFSIIKELNAFNIIDSMAEIDIFRNVHSAILTISITLFGLFVIWTFVKKIMDPEEGLNFSNILKEIFKCGFFIILSTLLFSEVSSFSIALSGFTSNIFKNNNTELSDTMLSIYVDYSDGYLESNNPIVDREGIKKNISNDKFSKGKMYNDKYVTSEKFILPNEKDYIYKINWIMAIIVGGFFLYALFFTGMMLARRQIEFLFLFLISPVVFATSIGNKQRRNVVIEQLVSLTLQAAVVMLIINITALVMQAVNNTVFFDNGFQNLVIKSLMFIGCGSFLLTGSQIINKFIGANISAVNGREQLMSLMGFGQSMSTTVQTGGLALTGAGLLGLGLTAKGIGGSKEFGNRAISGIGNILSNFGSKISNKTPEESNFHNLGSKISNFGEGMQSFANSKLNPKNKDGVNISSTGTRLSKIGGTMMNYGRENIQSAFDNIIPTRNMYRRRSRIRDL